MATWDRVLFNQLEKFASGDHNLQASLVDQTLREVMGLIFAGSSAGGTLTTYQTGFVGSSFQVFQPSTGRILYLRPGIGFIQDTSSLPTNMGGLTNVNDGSANKPLVLPQLLSVGVPAADAVNPRIDAIDVGYVRAVGGQQARDCWNVQARAFQPTPINKTLAWAISSTSQQQSGAPITYTMGVPSATPSPPSAPTGTTRIACVYVVPGESVIAQSRIADLRKILTPTGYVLMEMEFSVTINSGLSVLISSVTQNLPAGAQMGVSLRTSTTNQFDVAVLYGNTNSFTKVFGAATLQSIGLGRSLWTPGIGPFDDFLPDPLTASAASALASFTPSIVAAPGSSLVQSGQNGGGDTGGLQVQRATISGSNMLASLTGQSGDTYRVAIEVQLGR